MSGNGEAQDAQKTAPAAEKRVRLIRVKRKRGAEAPDDLVVEGLGAPGKRANTSLSSAMAGLGLEQPAAGDGGRAQEAAAGAAPAVRRQRYRKLSTLSAAQLSRMDQQQLSSLLAANQQQQQDKQQQQQPAHRAGVKGSAQQGASTVAATTASRAAQQLQVGQAARYEQIRRRRGFTNFSITEQAADPLQQLAAVYDVVRHDTGSEEGGISAAQDAPTAAGSAAAAAGQAAPAAGLSGIGGSTRRPSRQQRAAQQYDEGTLMCNYMPMIREYLRSQGRDLPDSPAAAGAAGAAGDGAAQQQQQQQQAQQAPEQEVADGGEGEGDDYVYDLYAAVSEDEGQEAEEAQQWWQLHASGHAPVVVQIVDDDTWEVVEAADVDDSDADSEDSNAEGFYAHDYPDEPSDFDSSDDGGYDPEGNVFHCGGRAGGAGRRQQRSWDELSYGYGSGGSD